MEMKKKLTAIFLTLTMLLSCTAVFAKVDTSFKSTVLDDFEFKDSRMRWWVQSNTIEDLVLSTKQAHSGIRSLKYSYKYDSAERAIISTEWRKGGFFISNSEQYNYLGMWVYGNATDLSMAIDIKTQEGEMKRYGFIPLAFEGWKYVEFQVDAGVKNWRLYNIVIKKPGNDYGTTGEIYIDDLTVSQNSYAEGSEQGSDMAGLNGVFDSTAVKEGAPTLQETDIPAVTRTSPQTAQLDNTNSYKTLVYKNSDKLPENISGVALSDDGTALNVMRGTRGVAWAAGWLNDGEELFGKTETCYSSSMYPSPAAEEWAMLKF